MQNNRSIVFKRMPCCIVFPYWAVFFVRSVPGIYRLAAFSLEEAVIQRYVTSIFVAYFSTTRDYETSPDGHVTQSPVHLYTHAATYLGRRKGVERTSILRDCLDMCDACGPPTHRMTGSACWKKQHIDFRWWISPTTCCYWSIVYSGWTSGEWRLTVSGCKSLDAG